MIGLVIAAAGWVLFVVGAVVLFGPWACLAAGAVTTAVGLFFDWESVRVKRR